MNHHFSSTVLNLRLKNALGVGPAIALMKRYYEATSASPSNAKTDKKASTNAARKSADYTAASVGSHSITNIIYARVENKIAHRASCPYLDDLLTLAAISDYPLSSLLSEATLTLSTGRTPAQRLQEKEYLQQEEACLKQEESCRSKADECKRERTKYREQLTIAKKRNKPADVTKAEEALAAVATIFAQAKETYINAQATRAKAEEARAIVMQPNPHYRAIASEMVARVAPFAARYQPKALISNFNLLFEQPDGSGSLIELAQAKEIIATAIQHHPATVIPSLKKQVASLNEAIERLKSNYEKRKEEGKINANIPPARGISNAELTALHQRTLAALPDIDGHASTITLGREAPTYKTRR